MTTPNFATSTQTQCQGGTVPLRRNVTTACLFSTHHAQAFQRLSEILPTPKGRPLLNELNQKTLPTLPDAPSCPPHLLHRYLLVIPLQVEPEMLQLVDVEHGHTAAGRHGRHLVEEPVEGPHDVLVDLQQPGQQRRHQALGAAEDEGGGGQL